MPLIRKDGGPPAAADPGADAERTLVTGTTDERWAAARTLSGRRQSVTALGAALANEQDARVREAILTGLARIGSPESAEAIVPLIRSDDASLRTGALDALRLMPLALETHLTGLLSDPDADVRLLACDLARQLPPAGASRLLSELLAGEPEVNVCAAAVEVLAECGGPEALKALADCAERFADTPFLSFSVRIAVDRIRAQAAELDGETEPVTEEEFRRLSEFLYRRTGMVFNETKRYYVQRRVNDRMAATGSTSFASYFARLRSDVAAEIEQLVNAFTVNETYFYREDHQLQCLTNDLLEERTRRRPRSEAIRIWSIPCSTGEEPYSIAIWLLENWARVDAYDIEIVGSDIDTRVLQAAGEGVFSKRALMRLSPDLIARYFEEMDDQQWRILDDIRGSVRFTAVNLVETGETRPHGQFDVIFCRNVLIYFDDASRRIAAENLYENLAPGGFICLGHTESMSRISPLFEVRRFADAIVYQRPERADD